MGKEWSRGSVKVTLLLPNLCNLPESSQKSWQTKEQLASIPCKILTLEFSSTYQYIYIDASLPSSSNLCEHSVILNTLSGLGLYKKFSLLQKLTRLSTAISIFSGLIWSRSFWLASNWSERVCLSLRLLPPFSLPSTTPIQQTPTASLHLSPCLQEKNALIHATMSSHFIRSGTAAHSQSESITTFQDVLFLSS